MGSSSIAGEGTSDDNDPEEMNKDIMAFCIIPFYSTEKITLPIRKYNNSKKRLEAAEHLNVCLQSSENVWKDERYCFKKELNRVVISGVCKAGSHLEHPSPSTKPSHNKLKTVKNGVDSKLKLKSLERRST